MLEGENKMEKENIITTHDLRKQNPFDFKCKLDCPQCLEEKKIKLKPREE